MQSPLVIDLAADVIRVMRKKDMPLYKATKIVLVLKKGGKNPIPCLFIIEGNNYSNLTNQSSVCCARLQEIIQFSNLPPSKHLAHCLYIRGTN